MTNNRPTESVTGQQSWQWNRWQTTQESEQIPARTAAGESEKPRGSSYERTPDREVRALRQEIAELESEIERKECQLCHIRAQYERRLDEKNRKLANRQSSAESKPAQTPLGRLVARLKSW